MNELKTKKSKQLGMNVSTAQGRLRKDIMFHLAQIIGLDICHQCGGVIETVEEFSIEHKIPWLDSEDPKGMFFDLDNIAFSHLSCNVRASRNGMKGNIEAAKKVSKKLTRRINENGDVWCPACEMFLHRDKFSKVSTRPLGVETICRSCRSIRRSKK